MSAGSERLDAARWATGPSRPLVPIGELHVWRADLDDSGGRMAAMSLLCSDDERNRAADIRDPVGRRRFVTRRGLHRVLLGGYAVGNHRIEIHTTVGHLGKDVLFAFGRTVELGISIVPVPDADMSLERILGLTNRERLALRRVAPERRQRLMCAVLAAKDAIGQARGRGMAGSIEEQDMLAILEPISDGGSFVAEIDGRPCAGALMRLDDDRLACVAHDGGTRALRTWSVGG